VYKQKLQEIEHERDLNAIEQKIRSIKAGKGKIDNRNPVYERMR
jgi:hypothetical protein